MRNSERSHENQTQFWWPEIPALFKTYDFAGPNAFVTDERALSIESLVWLNVRAADKHPSAALAPLAPYQESLILELNSEGSQTPIRAGV